MADGGYTIAQAYVQIMPSTEKFGSAIKNEMSTEGESAGGSFSGGFKKGLAVIGTATAAAGAAVGKLTTDAVKEFAEYEQLVGGVNKLFGDMDYQSVVDNASEAFRTAGMSTNEYMETITSFSASLIAGLEGDTQAAVNYADMAITDMSDNANVFGTDIAAIQNAYQGFAKQNYTMLDNLKLGYGGTKEEMQRLIEDANAVKSANGEMADLSIESFADVVEAIHIMQDEMNISGTTAREASTTIEGSLSSMKSAWHNLLIGLADDNQDFGKLVDDLIGTIVGFADESGERVGGVINNIMPRVETALQGISELVTTMVPEILGYLPGLIENLLPDLIEGATSLITSFIEVLPDIISAITDVLPDLLQTIGDGIITSMSTLTEKIPDIADSLSQTLSDVLTWVSENAGPLIDGFADFLSTFLTEGIRILSENTDELIEALFAVIKAVVTAAIEHPEIIAAIVGMNALKNIGSKIIGTIGDGLNSATSGLTKAITSAVTGSVQTVDIGDTGTAIGQSVGNKIISGLGTVLRTAGQSAVLVGGFIAFDHIVENLVVNNIKSTEMWQQARQEVDQVGESAMSLSEKYDYLNSKVGGHLDVLKQYVPENNAVLDTLEAIGGPLDKSTEGWLGVAEAMGYHGMAAQGVAQNLQMMYGDLWNEIQAEEAAKAATETLGATTETTSQQISTALSTMSSTWSATFRTEMPAALQDSITQASNAGIEIPQNLVDGILSGATDAEAAASQISALIQFETAVSEAAASGQEITAEFVQSLLDEAGLSGVISAAEVLGESAVPSIELNEIHTVGASVAQETAGGISENSYQASEAAGQMADEIMAEIDTLPGEMGAAGSESGSNLNSEFGNWRSTVSGTIDDMYQLFYQTLSQLLPPLMGQWGYSAGERYNANLEMAGGEIQSTAANIATNIESELSVLPGWLEAVGYNAGAGLYNGLAGWEGTLSSLAWQIADQINSAARAALRIKSPSKVMEEVGRFTAEGLSVGIEKGTVDVVESTDNMMHAISGTAGNYEFDSADVSTGNNIEGQLDEITDLLYSLRNLRVVMDSGEIVGVLAPEMSNEFERIRVRQGRG